MNSPFKFLDIYTREDRDIFFGREREIAELYHRIFESKILLVYGLSGTGKSSLIQCGLANKFEETDWFSLNIRRGNNIIESMHDAIKIAAHTPLKSNTLNSAGFLKSVRSLFLDYYKPIYFVFDQFEELFIFGDATEKAGFIEIIKELVTSDMQCRFIFVLREEYLACITEFEKTIPNFLANRVRIEKMTPANAKLAIEGPCKVFNIPVEHGFSDVLLERLCSADNEIELTYLQVFLDKLYRKAVTENNGKPLVFKTNLFEGTENVSDVLGSFLDEQIEHFPKPDDALLVLKSFISIKGTRRQMMLDEVKHFAISLGNNIVDESMKELIQKLIQLRILRDKDQNNRYELRHDALAAVIYKKISLVERDILEIRHFLENACVMYEKRGKLLAKEDLKYIAPYEDKLFLGHNINEFIAKSKKEIFRSRQRLRNYKIAGVLLTIFVLSGFTIWALTEKNKANRLYIKSKASTYNYLSKEVVENNPNAALRLAEYALELDPDNIDIHSNARNIYYNHSFYLTRKPFRENDQVVALSDKGEQMLVARGNNLFLLDCAGKELQKFEGHTNNIISASFSPDGTKILSGSYDRTARLWDLHGNTLQVLRGHGGETGHVTFSSDGQILLTSSWDRTSYLWNLNGQRLRSFSGYYLTALSPDGKTMAGNADKSFFTCDLEGRILNIFDGHTDMISSLSFSPNGRFILSGSRDKTARLWDLNGNTMQIFGGHPETVGITVFSSEGNLIFTGSRGLLQVWHISGLLQRTFKIQQEINYLTFAVKNDQVVATTTEGNLLLLDNSGNLQKQIRGPGGNIRFMQFSKDGRYLLAGSFAAANIWDSKGSLVISITNQSDVKAIQILSGVLTQNNQLILLYDDNTIRVWDLSGNLIKHWRTLPSTLVCASDDGKYILTNTLENTAILYDNSGVVLQTLIGHSGTITALAFSDNGQQILTGSMDKTARLWDINGKSLSVMSEHTGPITTVAFGNFDELIFTASAYRIETFADYRGFPRLLGQFTSDDNTIRTWDNDGNQKKTNQITHGNIRSVSFNTTGSFYLVGLENNAARVFGYEGHGHNTLAGHQDYVGAVAISPDGKRLATADQNIFIWDAMLSYEDFLAQNNFAPLSVSDKLRYGILDLKEVNRFNNENDLKEAAEYFFNNASFMREEKRLVYLDNSIQLYEKLNSRFNKPAYKLRLIEIHHLIDQDRTDRITKKYLNELLSTNDADDLLVSARFFASLSHKYGKLQHRETHLSNSARFYERFMNDFPLINVKTEAAGIYKLHTLALIEAGKFNEALKQAEKGIHIQNDLSMQANLAACYFFVNEYDAAMQIVQANDYDLLQGIRFRNELKSVFEKLELKGIIHTDYKRINSLLDKN